MHTERQVLFHPTKPFFFVATQTKIRIYNLAKQSLIKKLQGSSLCAGVVLWLCERVYGCPMR